MDVALANVPQNLERISRYVGEATASGAKLVIFPECAATGYCFDSADEAREFAQPIPGPITDTVQACCRKHDCFVVFGMLEASSDTRTMRSKLQSKAASHIAGHRAGPDQAAPQRSARAGSKTCWWRARRPASSWARPP